jgi:glycosyltransferase involved in cell wall biosynthesis
VRVLHIVKTATGCTWAYYQIRVLQEVGVDVVVALPSVDEGLGPAYRRLGVKVVAANLDFPARRPWAVLPVLSACRRLVDQVQPDLIHLHHVGPTLVVRLALGKNHSIPRVFQVPGPLHLESEFFAGLDKNLAGGSDYWIATCEWIFRKYLELGVKPERIFLSYLGTDIHRFDALRSGTLRSELGIRAETPLIGIVAYMYAPKWFLGQERGLKGHEDFFAALDLARGEWPEVRAVAIGGAWDNAGWYENRVRYRGRTICNGFLTFLGTRPDVALLYPDLDLAVAPSHSENCGPVVEPLLSGVPVVASNVGGLPDVIRDGETGWLVPPRDPRVLARTILEALRNTAEARRRTESGQRLVRDRFDANRTGREIAQIYGRILGQIKPSEASCQHAV